jgi:hypothetical protein
MKCRYGNFRRRCRGNQNPAGPTEQPPGKLSGKRTRLSGKSGERLGCFKTTRPPKGKLKAGKAEVSSQAKGQMGTDGVEAVSMPNMSSGV